MSALTSKDRVLAKPPRNLACNALCGKCLRHCKQPPAAVLVDCPRYLPRPFKITEHRFDQLELFEKKR